MIIKNKILQEQAEHVEHGLTKVQHLLADPELMSWFADDFALLFCWSSNAIEGNTLSLDETVALVEYDEVRAGHTYTEYHEAKTLYRAIRMSMIPFHFEAIKEDWIKKNNRVIMDVGGGYRTGNVRVGSLFETSHVPPDFTKVPRLMQDFLDTVNFSKGPVLETFKEIAVQHITFERIHPFADGNGRTGRMIMNQQLINHGFLPVAITKNSTYMQAFRQYGRNGDYSKLLHELLKAEIEAIGHLIAFEQKREQGLNWDPKMTLEDQIKAAGNLQANKQAPAAHKALQER